VVVAMGRAELPSHWRPGQRRWQRGGGCPPGGHPPGGR
jgi:hypothetical protein